MALRNCPLCGSPDPQLILSLGNQPLADTFLPADRASEPEVTYPLSLVKCLFCSHFFTSAQTSPHLRYVANEYSYESANSKISVSHFSELARECILVFGEPPESLSVLDVGSNDGTLLTEFQNLGVRRVLGIDPSPNMSKLAERRGIPTVEGFFDQESLEELRQRNSEEGFSLVVSANVFNHAEDPKAFLSAVSMVLAAGGIFVFEVPNIADLLDLRAFETIYHEHVHYWSIAAISRILEKHGFSILKVEQIDYMCGSLRVFASRAREEGIGVRRAILQDASDARYSEEGLKTFAEDIVRMKLLTIRFVADEKLKGSQIVGVGAATKGNTLLNYFGWGPDTLDFVTDTATAKVGKLTPGSKILIKDDDALKTLQSNALVIILAWNLDLPLRKKFADLPVRLFTPQKEFGPKTKSERAELYGKDLS